MKRWIFLLLFSATGCSQIGGCSGCTKKLPIIGQSEEERVAEEQAQKKTAEENLRAADILVLKWATEVEKSQVKHVEGLTDVDPWGNTITVHYEQKWFNEVATVRSSGPDQKPNTADDLVRTRTYPNPSGILGGISGFGWFLMIWVGCAVLAFFASAGVAHNRRSSGKSGKHRHPFAFFLVIVILAPFALLVYGLQFLGGALGASGDFFDGFEFDFSLDIDL